MTAPAPLTSPRRWLRRSLLGVISLLMVLAGAVWLLGREATLQTLLQKVAAASGGQIAVSEVSGSLYGAMHLGHIEYRSLERTIRADHVDISWSPLQYFSKGIAISQLDAASLVVENLGPSTAAVLPTTLALPFQLSISEAHLRRLTVQNGGVSTVFSALRFQLNADAHSWRLQQASVTTPWGQLSAHATLGASRPFPLDGAAKLTDQPAAALLAATFGGSLKLLTVNATASAAPASASAHLTLAPFDAVILQAAEVTGSDINPARFNPAWPQANLTLQLAARIDARQRLSGTLALLNADSPGTLDRQRLPLRSIHAQLGGDLHSSNIEAVNIDLGAGGKLTGAGRIEHGVTAAGAVTASLNLHTDALNLQGLDAGLRKTHIQGQIQVGSNGAQQTLTARLAQDGLRLDLQASLSEALLRVEQARLQMGQNTLTARGAFGAPGQHLYWRLDAPKLNAVSPNVSGALSADGVIEGSMSAPRSSFQADAKALALAPGQPANSSVLHASGIAALTGPGHRLELSQLSGSLRRLNPAAFGPYPTGSVNADVSGAVRLGADWRVGLNLALLPSTLAGAPLTGHAALTAEAARISNADLDLHLGPNRLQAHGNAGAAFDHLDWTLDAPQLAALGPQFSGAVSGSGRLSGSLAAPALNFTLAGRQVRLFGQQIKSLNASANIGAAAGAQWQAALDLKGYSKPGFALAETRLRLSGTRTAHTLQLAARNDDFDAALQVTGGYHAGAWNGTLDSLHNQGRVPFNLHMAAALRVSGAPGSGAAGLLHPALIALSNARLNLASGSITLQSLEKNGPHWRSAGQAAGVPLALLTQLTPLWRDNASSDLTLGGQWSIDWQPQTIAGTLHLYREQGDITFLGERPVTLGLRKFDVRLDALNDALRLQLALDGARAGQIELNGSAHMVNGHLADSSALTLTANAALPSLAWLAPLSGQPGLELDGALKLALSAGGSLGAPVLKGDITGDKLVVNWADQGVKLHNGQLQATLAGDQLQVQRLNFDGVEGKLQVSGALRFANAVTSMELKLVMDHLQALSRPDRTLVVSGQSTLLRDQQHFQLSGKLKAERAVIELGAQDTPTRSADVVVLNQTSAKAAPSLPLTIDLDADLGDDFQLRGKGLEAQLAGSLRLRMVEHAPARVNGSIRVVSGTYDAYGQKLQIERGLLNFTGAYDNPGLNILAVRKGPEGVTVSETNVEAGVEVRGTALAPTAKLVSTPSVSDSDKLAWLVLGHSSEGSGTSDLGLLTSAAGALFGNSQGASLQTRLAHTLGVDDLGVGQASSSTAVPAKGLESTVVTVGKRISQRVYLSFEQGASSASSLVKLRYKLNPRVTLQFQTGANNALDVLYNWAFD